MPVLACVKRSQHYRTLHRRLATTQPSESWVEGSITYVVFDLIDQPPVGAISPLALFAVHHQSYRLLFVRLVTPHADATSVNIIELNMSQEDL